MVSAFWVVGLSPLLSLDSSDMYFPAPRCLASWHSEPALPMEFSQISLLIVAPMWTTFLPARAKASWCGTAACQKKNKMSSGLDFSSIGHRCHEPEADLLSQYIWKPMKGNSPKCFRTICYSRKHCLLLPLKPGFSLKDSDYFIPQSTLSPHEPCELSQLLHLLSWCWTFPSLLSLSESSTSPVILSTWRWKPLNFKS